MRRAVPILIGVNIALFLLQQLVSGLTESLLLVSADVLTRPWILLTSMFLHASPSHLLFNMYALWLFGSILESRIGTKRFVQLYFITGLAAALGASFFYARALGASGAVMGVVGAMIIIMPDLRLLFFFAIPMRLRTAGIIWAAIDAFGVLYPSGTANIAHLVGLGVGLLLGRRMKGKAKRIHNVIAKKTHLDEEDVEEYLKSGRL